MPDEEDRPRDASGAAGSGWMDGDDLTVAWATAVAPDDISELTDDVRTYHRELRAIRRAALLRRVFDRRGATPITMAISALALVAIVLTLLSLTAPGSTPRATSLPRYHPTAAPGHLGGLVPDVPLTSLNGAQVSAAALHYPGVLAVVPEPCGCQQLLNLVHDQAAAQGLALTVVSPGSDAEAAALRGPLHGSPAVYTDETSALNTAVNGQGVTLVLVNSGGLIYTVLRAETPQLTAGLTRVFHTMLAQKPPSG